MEGQMTLLDKFEIYFDELFELAKKTNNKLRCIILPESVKRQVMIIFISMIDDTAVSLAEQAKDKELSEYLKKQSKECGLSEMYVPDLSIADEEDKPEIRALFLGMCYLVLSVDSDPE